MNDVDAKKCGLIGLAIGKVFAAMKESDAMNVLTVDNLTLFGEYLNYQESTMPMTDPTYYRDRGHDEIIQIRARIKVLSHMRIVMLAEAQIKPPVEDSQYE